MRPVSGGGSGRGGGGLVVVVGSIVGPNKAWGRVIYRFLVKFSDEK